MVSNAPPEESERGLGTSFPPFRILIVEDDEDMRDLLLEGLSEDGHVVVGCARVDDALTALEEQPFDVLITDMRLPGASGFELLSLLHTRGEKALARIVITGFASAELHDSAEALGAIAVFDKPFDLDDLRSTILSMSA